MAFSGQRSANLLYLPAEFKEVSSNDLIAGSILAKISGFCGHAAE
jgi:hypothetical protein